MAVDLDAQCTTHATGRTVGTHHQPCQQYALAGLIGDPHLAVAVDHFTQAQEPHRPVTAQPRQLLKPRFQRLAEVAGDHHLAEPRPVVIGRFQLHTAEIAGTADVDAPDRARCHRQLLHHPQRGQRIDGGSGKTEIALVEHRRQLAGRAGLEQAHVAAEAVQGNGQAGADQATTDNQHVMSFTHAFMIRARPVCTPNGRSCANPRGGLE